MKKMDFESPRVWPREMVGQEVVFLDRPSPVVACTAEEDKARQEYALQADIKYQIQRFGVGHPLQGGQLDFDHLDLTKAFELVEEASQAWLRLPSVVRDRYQSWSAVERAAQSGELEQVLKAAGVPEVPSGAPGASASDSAAGSGAKPV